jgi:2'-5' RNA ligase
VRLFVAIEPDARSRARLAEILRDAQAHLGRLAASLRWNAPENIHITLHFLGEVSDYRVATLRSALGEQVPIAPFDVVTGGLGTFPAAALPKVIWIGVDGGADLVIQLHAECGRRLAAAGHSPEDRPFSPHLTLGRVREQHRRDAKRIGQALRAIRIEPIRWQVDHATLFRSHLSSSAPRYEALQSIALSDYN